MSTKHQAFNGFKLSALATALVVAGCTSGHMEQLRPIYRISDDGSGRSAVLDHYSQGRRYFERGRYGLALAEFQSELAKHLSSVRSLNGLAACYDKLGRYDVAVRYYHMALKIDPDSTVTMNNLGYSLALQGKPTNANTVLGLALRKDPDNGKARANQQLVVAGMGTRGQKPGVVASSTDSHPAIQKTSQPVASASTATAEVRRSLAEPVAEIPASAVPISEPTMEMDRKAVLPFPPGKGWGEGIKRDGPVTLSRSPHPSLLPEGEGTAGDSYPPAVVQGAPLASAEVSEPVAEPEIYSGLVSMTAEVTEAEPQSVVAEPAIMQLAQPSEPTVIVTRPVEQPVMTDPEVDDTVIEAGAVYELQEVVEADQGEAEMTARTDEAISPATQPAPGVTASLPPTDLQLMPESAEPTLYIATESGDSLWHIAKRLIGEKQVGIMQMIAGLFRSNPEAFIDGDMDRLKVGFLLWIPSGEEIAAMEVNDLVQEKVQHYAAAMEISNGNGRRGMARMMGDYLRDQGEQVVRITNASSFSMSQSIIHYAPGQIDEARRLAERLPVAADLRETLPDKGRISVRLVIGQDILEYEDSMRRALLFSGRA